MANTTDDPAGASKDAATEETAELTIFSYKMGVAGQQMGAHRGPDFLLTPNADSNETVQSVLPSNLTFAFESPVPEWVRTASEEPRVDFDLVTRVASKDGELREDNPKVWKKGEVKREVLEDGTEVIRMVGYNKDQTKFQKFEVSYYPDGRVEKRLYKEKDPADIKSKQGIEIHERPEGDGDHGPFSPPGIRNFPYVEGAVENMAAALCRNILVADSNQSKKTVPPLVIGGDHSQGLASAVGGRLAAVVKALLSDDPKVQLKLKCSPEERANVLKNVREQKDALCAATTQEEILKATKDLGTTVGDLIDLQSFEKIRNKALFDAANDSVQMGPDEAYPTPGFYDYANRVAAKVDELREKAQEEVKGQDKGVLPLQELENFMSTFHEFWFDAHADWNNEDTSETKNFHGMPLAAMSGHSVMTNALGTPFLEVKPQNTHLFGIRDTDTEEYKLIYKAGVDVKRVKEIEDARKKITHPTLTGDALKEYQFQWGLKQLFDDTFKSIEEETLKKTGRLPVYGLSYDGDGIHATGFPDKYPGQLAGKGFSSTGTPVSRGGPTVDQAMKAVMGRVHEFKDEQGNSRVLFHEVSETNPILNIPQNVNLSDADRITLAKQYFSPEDVAVVTSTWEGELTTSARQNLIEKFFGTTDDDTKAMVTAAPDKQFKSFIWEQLREKNINREDGSVLATREVILALISAIYADQAVLEKDRPAGITTTSSTEGELTMNPQEPDLTDGESVADDSDFEDSLEHHTLQAANAAIGEQRLRAERAERSLAGVQEKLDLLGVRRDPHERNLDFPVGVFDAQKMIGGADAKVSDRSQTIINALKAKGKKTDVREDATFPEPEKLATYSAYMFNVDGIKFQGDRTAKEIADAASVLKLIGDLRREHPRMPIQICSSTPDQLPAELTTLNENLTADFSDKPLLKSKMDKHLNKVTYGNENGDGPSLSSLIALNDDADALQAIADRVFDNTESFLGAEMPFIVQANVRWLEGLYDPVSQTYTCPGHQQGIGLLKGNPADQAVAQIMGWNLTQGFTLKGPETIPGFFAADVCNSMDAAFGQPLEKTGPVGDDEKVLAELFHADAASIILNGSSQAVIMAEKQQLKRGDLIFADSNCHQSTSFAVAGSGAIVIKIPSERMPDGTFAPPRLEDMTPEKLSQLVREDNYFKLNPDMLKKLEKDAKGNFISCLSVITGTTYDGVSTNIKAAVEMLAKSTKSIHLDAAWLGLGVIPRKKSEKDKGLVPLDNIPSLWDIANGERPPVQITWNVSLHKFMNGVSETAMLCKILPAGKKIQGAFEIEVTQEHFSTSPLYTKWLSGIATAYSAIPPYADRLVKNIQQNSMEARADVERGKREWEGNSANAETPFLFSTFGPEVLNDDGTIKDYSHDLFLLKAGQKHHAFTVTPGKENFQDYSKFILRTPMVKDRKTGELIESGGVPAWVAVKFFEGIGVQGIVTEKTTVDGILFMISPGTTKEAIAKIKDAWTQFQRAYAQNKPLAEAIPSLAEKQFYKDLQANPRQTLIDRKDPKLLENDFIGNLQPGKTWGLKDFCDYQFNVAKHKNITKRAKTVYDAKPVQIISALDAEELKKTDGGEIKLYVDSLKNYKFDNTIDLSNPENLRDASKLPWVVLTPTSVYPPGAPINMPGCALTDEANTFFQDCDEFENVSPGVGLHPHGVYECDEDGRLFVRVANPLHLLEILKKRQIEIETAKKMPEAVVRTPTAERGNAAEDALNEANQKYPELKFLPHEPLVWKETMLQDPEGQLPAIDAQNVKSPFTEWVALRRVINEILTSSETATKAHFDQIPDKFRKDGEIDIPALRKAGIVDAGFKLLLEDVIEQQQQAPNVHIFSALRKGANVPLSDFSGKLLLITNTAGGCGYTGQLNSLQALKDQFPGKLEVLAFPTDQFLAQARGENGNTEEICMARKANYPIFDQIDVIGENAHPLFEFMTDGDQVLWNFDKTLVNEQGKVLKRYPPQTTPGEIAADIDKLQRGENLTQETKRKYERDPNLQDLQKWVRGELPNDKKDALNQWVTANPDKVADWSRNGKPQAADLTDLRTYNKELAHRLNEVYLVHHKIESQEKHFTQLAETFFTNVTGTPLPPTPTQEVFAKVNGAHDTLNTMDVTNLPSDLAAQRQTLLTLSAQLKQARTDLDDVWEAVDGPFVKSDQLIIKEERGNGSVKGNIDFEQLTPDVQDSLAAMQDDITRVADNPMKLAEWVTRVAALEKSVQPVIANQATLGMVKQSVGQQLYAKLGHAITNLYSGQPIRPDIDHVALEAFYRKNPNLLTNPGMTAPESTGLREFLDINRIVKQVLAGTATTELFNQLPDRYKATPDILPSTSAAVAAPLTPNAAALVRDGFLNAGSQPTFQANVRTAMTAAASKVAEPTPEPMLVPYVATAAELLPIPKGHNAMKDIGGIFRGKMPSTSKPGPSQDAMVRAVPGSGTIMQLGDGGGDLQITPIHREPNGRFILATTQHDGANVSVLIRPTDCPARTGGRTYGQLSGLPLNQPHNLTKKVVKQDDQLSKTSSRDGGKKGGKAL